jgi:hypothetical protein
MLIAVLNGGIKKANLGGNLLGLLTGAVLLNQDPPIPYLIK